MCIKGIISTIVFIFNIICFCVGVALLAIGIMYKVSFSVLTDKLPSDYTFLHNIPISAIVVGTLIVVISFCGCCGVVKQSPCLLTTYAVILLVLFIAQVAIGIWAFVSIKDKDDLETKVENTITEIFNKYGENAKPFDAIQEGLDCCGLKGPSDWNNQIPNSCYANKDDKTTLYQNGCLEKITDLLENSIKIIGIVLIALSATEIVGGVLALCLANSARNKMRRNEYY